MKSDRPIVKQLLRDSMDDLTRTERKLASELLKDYPMAGLQSVTRLAALAEVSTPTVIRMARKLGFDGFSAMQAALRAEAAEQIKQPILKGADWPDAGEGGHALDRFAEAVAANLRHTLERLDIATFDAVTALLADAQREIFIAGGRITRSNADYLFNHLQIIRPGVQQLSPSPNVWPQVLLDIGPGAILVLFDIRRYEADLLKLAQLASERGATIVLFTDQWGSPIGKTADHVFNALVEVPSSWDSTVALMLIVEALIAGAQGARWDDSRARLEQLEAMFSTAKLFRKFT